MPGTSCLAARGRQGDRQRQAAKESLARVLAQHWLAQDLPDLTLGHYPWGQPRIFLGAAAGPAVSFSWSAGRLWGAVGRSERGLGMDAAAPGEFAGSYPYLRVFNAAEWQAALDLTAGRREEAAALLWSVKEAAVKAWGCGFRFLSPRQVEAIFAGPEQQGCLWRGSLGTPELPGALPATREPWAAVAVRLPAVWLAVAWGRGAVQPLS